MDYINEVCRMAKRKEREGGGRCTLTLCYTYSKERAMRDQTMEGRERGRRE